MGNGQGSHKNMVHSLSDLESDNTIINQGTSMARKPQLTFHTVHGSNVELRNGNRVARRKESFCKGLAFSNRAIGIEENVCLQLTEVATNWSGVLRFGVCNVDPETFRNASFFPKFVCPDLTSKEGFWAKALPERYSVEGNILHFNVTADGELFYGVNGVQKGVFLVGINVELPLWIILDIYGNSVAVEFVDASDFRPPRNSRAATVARTSLPTPVVDTVVTDNSSMILNNLPAAPANVHLETIRFHYIMGKHINLHSNRTVATRVEQEYTQGYVFTERPIPNNEKVVLQVLQVINAYNGGLAFGVTVCDPSTLRGMEMPDDSSDLIEKPEYWVGIKDIALQPAVNSILSFWITDNGEVKFEKDNNGARTVIHVDNTLPLYMWFDCYGATRSIRMLGCANVRRSPLPRTATASSDISTSSIRVALPYVPQPTRRGTSATPSRVNSSLRVDMNNRSSTDNEPRAPRRTVDDILGLDMPSTTSTMPVRPAPPSRARAPIALPTRVAPPIPTTPIPTTPNPSTVDRSDVHQFLPPAPTLPPPPLPSRNPYEQPKRAVVVGATAVTVAQAKVMATPADKDDNDDLDDTNECNVCMSNKINSVLYTCGHMCMCYECAQMTFKSSKQCPLCRTEIKDIIRTYKS